MIQYEYLTGEEFLPSNQRQIIEQTKFTYSPSGKVFEKQTEKQVDTTKSLDPCNKLKQPEIWPQIPDHNLRFLTWQNKFII